MKQPSSELFELINGLSLSEKRYCTLYLQKHSAAKENRYLRLFDFLGRQKVYDSRMAQNYMGYQQQPAHYAVLKKQLFEQLLDALHQFDLFTNAEQQLLRGIHQCYLLLQKGMFKACEKRVKNLSATAAQMNHYEGQLQLQQLKMMTKARNYYRHDTEETLQDWNAETHAVLQQMEVTNRYRYLSSRVFKIQYESGTRGKEQATLMQAIIQLPEFADAKRASTSRAYLDFLQVRALYHFTNLETEKAAGYNEKFLQLLDSNPTLLQLHADRYFSVLNNYLIDCLVLKRYKVLEDGLAKMRSLPKIAAFKRLVNFAANVFRLGYLLEMNYMLTTENFAGAYAKIPAITAGLALYADKIVKHNRITLQYLMAYVCFMLKKYDEALDHLQFILQQKETAVAGNVQLAARMLQLLSHFEKGDALLLESLIKSLRRYLKADISADMQRTVISFIQAASRKQTVIPKQWSDLNKKLVKLAADKSSAASMNLFNYLLWVKAHLAEAGKG